MSTLNLDQQNAADEFFKFLMDDRKEISLSGPAGVGKTYLLQYFADRLLPMYRDACKSLGLEQKIQQVVYTATTNRAADVLTRTMGQDARTIHSFLNLKVYDDYSTGKQKLTKSNNFKEYENTLIFIDESSMVDRPLHTIIHEATTSSCKIVYVGDHCQMAPVGEKLSIVWSSPHIQRIDLTTPVRNAGQPALINLCNQFRETVETGIFKPIDLVPGVIELLTGPEMQNHVDRLFTPHEHGSRILTYTNQEAKSYNDYIRGNRNYGMRLNTGEVVVVNKGIELVKQGTLPAEMEFQIKVPNLPDENIDADGMNIVAYKVDLISLKTGAMYTAYQADDPEYLHKVIKYFASNKDWSNYFRLINMFPDLRGRDSSTVYKAQGSTFGTVYIDLSDIGKCRVPDQAARMLYVSASRAQNRIYFYGSLPDNYLGG